MKMNIISTLSVISGILLSGSVLAADMPVVPITYVTQGDPDGSVPKTVKLNYLVTDFDGTDIKGTDSKLGYNSTKNLQTWVDENRKPWGVTLQSVQEGSKTYQAVGDCDGVDDATNRENWPAQGINLVREKLSNKSIVYRCEVYLMDPANTH